MFHGSPAVTSRRCPEGRTHLWGRLPTPPTSPRRSRLGWPQCSSKSSTRRCSTLQPRPNTSVHTRYCWPRVARSSGTFISQCDWLHRICVSLQCRLILLLRLGFEGAADWITRVNDSSCFSPFFFYENITSAIPSLHRAVSFSVDRAIQIEGKFW